MEKRLSLRKDTDFQKVYKKSNAFYNRDFTILVKKMVSIILDLDFLLVKKLVRLISAML